MKTTLLAVIFSVGVAAPLFADDTNVLNDDRARAGYAVGMMFGRSLQQQGMDVDPELVLRGIKDEQAGGATLLTQPDAQTAIKAFQEKSRADMAVKNKAAGEAFLATNKNNPGVVTLPDGLQYKIIAEGMGAMPAANSTVTVNYRGTFLDGREFDNSARAGHPAKFPIGNVIHGWTEALLQMKTGAKWRLFIPSDLAYGVPGRMPIIPPNAMLIFDVELLDAQNPPVPQPAMPAPAASPAQPPLTSDIIAVQGTNVQIIKREDVQKMQSSSQTN